MNRAEAYAEGYADGVRWAEGDIRDHVRVDPEYMLEDAGDLWKATALGHRRGYRDTWARWDDGRLTWQMLEHAPVGS